MDLSADMIHILDMRLLNQQLIVSQFADVQALVD